MSQYIKRTGEIVIGTIAAAFISALIALLCTGALVFLSGVLFWVLDDFVFDLLNLSPKFTYDVLALLRSMFFWLEDDGFKALFFILWAIILFAGLKGDWIKEKLKKLWTHQ